MGILARAFCFFAALLTILSADVEGALAGAPATTARIAATLSPDRLGAKASLTLRISYTGGPAGVPSPVRRSVLRLPAGLALYVPSLQSCSAARLLARGVSGCPARSLLGSGHAQVQALAGSLIIAENVFLHVFLGPPANLQPTFEILAQGYTPLEQRVVFSGFVQSDSPPYGEELVLSIPPVPTLPLEPDASIVTLSLTIGSDRREGGRTSVLVPRTCPWGGFPFAATFTYADQSESNANAAIPCQR